MNCLVRQKGIKNVFLIDGGNVLIYTNEFVEIVTEYERIFINNMIAFRSYAQKAGLSPNDWQQFDPEFDEEFEFEKEKVS